MDTLAMARTGLSLKSTFKSSSNSAYSQMPDLPDTTHAYETLSRGWTSLVDTVSSTGSSIMQSRSLSNAGSHREIPPVTGGSSSNDTPLVSTTAASGLWQRCYDSIAGSYQMAGSAGMCILCSVLNQALRQANTQRLTKQSTAKLI